MAILTRPLDSVLDSTLDYPIDGALGFDGGGVVAPAAAFNSIQEVEIALTGVTSNTATITSVDTNLSSIFFNGFRANSAPRREAMSAITLTNATTVTATKQLGVNNAVVRGTVVEWKDTHVESVEYGTITLGAGVGSNTATITSVDTSRSAVMYLGFTTADTGTTTTWDKVSMSISLTNGTTVTATRGDATSAAAADINFCVVQFQADVIESVQEVAISSANASDTATITAVDTSNSLLIFNGQENPTFQNIVHHMIRSDLTNSTTVTFNRNTAGGNMEPIVTVVEFTDGTITSNQNVSETFAASTSTKTATITSVDTSNALILYNGFQANETGINTCANTQEITDATTVTANTITNVANEVIFNSQVVELQD